jgi:hypothetical protein
LVTILKELLLPTEDQQDLLEDETNDVWRGYIERSMMAKWAKEQAKTNTTIRPLTKLSRNNAIKEETNRPTRIL